MKFIKNLKFDMHNGIFKNIPLFLCPIIIAMVIFADANNRIIRLGGLWTSGVSFGDYWVYAYGGMKEYIPAPDNPFQFPVIWILVFIIIPFILLNYPMKDMQNIGPQILVRSQARSRWWISKCVWNINGTCIYHGMLVGTLAVMCKNMDIPLSFNIHTDLLKMLFVLDMDTVLLPRTFLPVSVVILPPLISVALNMFQMMLTLFMKPIFSFLAIAVVILASAYILSPVAIGNFAMPMRYSWVLKNGVSYQMGIGVSGGLILISLVIGLFRFRLYDILEKD